MKSAPCNQAIRALDGSRLNDPAQFAMTMPRHARERGKAPRIPPRTVDNGRLDLSIVDWPA